MGTAAMQTPHPCRIWGHKYKGFKAEIQHVRLTPSYLLYTRPQDGY